MKKIIRFISGHPVIFSIILGIAMIVCYFKLIYMNFHPVINGEVYRSAQISDYELDEVIREYGIKSVLNLRGEKKHSGWYVREKAIADRAKIAHYDYQTSAVSFIDYCTLNEIARIMLVAPKPLLIHCEGGADRSGLVSALYKYKIAGYAPEKASKELSIVYGHFPYLGNRTRMMGESFGNYVMQDKNGTDCAYANQANGK